jgi:uncharacterized protein (UPF0332 family)
VRGPTTRAELAEGQLSGLRPERLLSHARQLAERTANTNSPRSVHARRAISAAYYALFHRLCINVTWSVVPGGSDHVRWAFCRTFDHGPIESVARWVQGQHRAPRSIAGLVDVAVQSEPIRTLTEKFVLLKQLRHDADYNHLIVLSRDNALDAVQECRAALDAVDAVYGEPPWQAFASLVLLKSNAVDR